MIPIPSTVSRPAAPTGAWAAERPARPGPPPAPQAPLRPLRDEYVPEEKRGSYGRYWPGRDRDGSPKIYFDDPEAAEDASASPEPPGEEAPGEGPAAPGRAAPAGGERREERCTADTDKVDREIRRLKEERGELKERLSSETDEARIGELERRLSRVESELRRKDNDAYRRRHAVFTES